MFDKNSKALAKGRKLFYSSNPFKNISVKKADKKWWGKYKIRILKSIGEFSIKVENSQDYKTPFILRQYFCSFKFFLIYLEQLKYHTLLFLLNSLTEGDETDGWKIWQMACQAPQSLQPIKQKLL